MKPGGIIATPRVNAQRTVYQMWRKIVSQSSPQYCHYSMHLSDLKVLSVLLCGAETWTMTQHDIHMLKSFQIRCLHDILGITLWDQVRNTDILKRMRMVTVEGQLRQRCLQWFGHVWRVPTSHPQRQLLSGRGRPAGGAPFVGVTSLTKTCGTSLTGLRLSLTDSNGGPRSAVMWLPRS